MVNYEDAHQKSLDYQESTCSELESYSQDCKDTLIGLIITRFGEIGIEGQLLNNILTWVEETVAKLEEEIKENVTIPMRYNLCQLIEELMQKVEDLEEETENKQETIDKLRIQLQDWGYLSDTHNLFKQAI